MLDVLFALLRALLSGFRPHSWLVLENLALRHQLAVLKRRRTNPNSAPPTDCFGLACWRFWPDWQQALLLFQPQTVIAWHRLGFRLFWRWKSRARDGRPSLDSDLIALIAGVANQPHLGQPRIQAELAKLGIEISDSTIRKYRLKHRRSASTQTWKTFLYNHTKELVAINFFTVPTAIFRVLYVFVVLAHERRKVLHFQYHAGSLRRLGRPTNGRSLSCYYSTALSASGPGSIYGADFVLCVEGLGLEQKDIRGI